MFVSHLLLFTCANKSLLALGGCRDAAAEAVCLCLEYERGEHETDPDNQNALATPMTSRAAE